MSETILFWLFVAICVYSVAGMAVRLIRVNRRGGKGQIRTSALKLAVVVVLWVALLAYFGFHVFP